MNKGDNICKNCFEERKKSASNYNEEHGIILDKFSSILQKKYSIFDIPLWYVYAIGSFALGTNYLYRKIKYGIDGILYHVYINGEHEKWTLHHENDSNLVKCCKCNIFNNDYFNLYSID